ncbi:hypothetical protein IG631_08051 [Alternaria alternata]|nr:hypothetical protein IG631_08051 [Alternaria alternata]
MARRAEPKQLVRCFARQTFKRLEDHAATGRRQPWNVSASRENRQQKPEPRHFLMTPQTIVLRFLFS